MLQVRKKTAVRSFAARIDEMSEAGVPLSWDRYETQLPLCGFTQNGLNCSACFQGPCRINPFGDLPDRGACGLSGAQVVLHNFFGHVRRGALDHLNVWLNELPDERSRDAATHATAALVDRLPGTVAAGLRKRGLLPRNLFLDVMTARNPFAVDPAAIDASLAGLLRLGVCSLLSSAAIVELCPTLSQDTSDEDPSTGVTVLIDGTLPRTFLNQLHAHAAGDGHVRVMGTAGNGFLHGRDRAFLSPGSPELAIASAEVDFVLQSDLDGYPALAGACEAIGVPRATILDGAWPLPATIVERAREHRRQAGAAPAGDAGLAVRTNPFPADAGAWIHEAVTAKSVRGVVLLVAGTNVRQTHFERTIKVATGLLRKDVILLVAGDAAAMIGPVAEELAKAAGPQVAEVFARHPHPWLSVGSVFETARALDVLSRLAGPHGFAGVPVAATFLEMPTAPFLAAALGWLALGVPTQLGSPLPLWGDAGLTRKLTDETGTSWGARLLASPTLPAPEEQVAQLLAQLEPARPLDPGPCEEL